MNAFTTLPPADLAIVREPARLIALSRMLDAVADAELERTIEMLIAIRDARDCDSDVEPNGDELDVATARFCYASPYQHDQRLPEHKFTEAALATEDDEEADPAEPNGDELDGTGGEDDFVRHGQNGPGCPVSDPDYSIDELHDGGAGVGDRTYAEWHTLPASTRRAGGIDGKPIDARSLDEDVEDDDADMSVEDDPRGVDPEEDVGGEERGEISAWPEKGEGAQSINMLGGVAVDAEDDEPRHVPASMDRREPANAS